MVEEKIDKINKEQNKDKKTYILDIAGKGESPDFHTECLAKTKTEAYEIMIKQHPGLGKSKESAVLKLIKIKK